jgi:hypothetical protein
MYSENQTHEMGVKASAAEAGLLNNNFKCSRYLINN